MGNVQRYGKKVKNRDNRRSQASLWEEGSTTIESIAMEKDHSKEVSRVGSDSERRGISYLLMEYEMNI